MLSEICSFSLDKNSTKAVRVYKNCDLSSLSVLSKETIEKNRDFFIKNCIFGQEI